MGTKRNNFNKPVHKRKKSGIGILQILVIGFFVAIVAGGGFSLYIYYTYAEGLPSLSKLIEYKPLQISKVYDVKGRLIGEFFVERRVPIAHDDIPPLVRNAFVAIEDQRYFAHNGIDFRGIGRAFYQNIVHGEIKQGASTITMQVARSFFLTRERSINRKIKETLLAVKIEKDLSKAEILTLYLNQIYLGHGAYGIVAAAEEYFGKHVDKLSLGECALLAALPKNPSGYDPFKHMDSAIERRDLVLAKMHELGMISDEELAKGKAEKIDLVTRVDLNKSGAAYFVEYVRQYLVQQYGNEQILSEGYQVFTTIDAEWNESAAKSIKWGLRRMDKLSGWRGPIKELDANALKEYLDKTADRYSRPPATGKIVEAVVVSVPNTDPMYAKLMIGKFAARLPKAESKWAKKLNTLPYEKAKIGVKPRSEFKVGDVVDVEITAVDADGTLVVSLDQEPLIEGALFSVDPYTGEVRAMIGGYDFRKSEFNRALQAKRQPGSSFKPIVYTAAIESSFNPSSVINDSALMFEGWNPGNFDRSFSGPQTLAYALQRSVNTVSIRLAMAMGVDRVIKFARTMGIESELPRDLSIALGTANLPMAELMKAYGVLAAEGRSVPYVFVRRVYDRDGNMLEDRVPRVQGFDTPPDNPESFRKWCAANREPMWGPEGMAFRRSVAMARGRQALDPRTAYIMISLLRNVVEAGTGTNARLTGIEVVGKTGTTNDNKDALFIGFTTQLLTGVWVGYDDGRVPIGKGAGNTGGDVSAPIFQRYMRSALEGKGIPDFPRPDGLTIYTFDCLTGTFPGPEAEKICRAAFMDGVQPADYVPPAGMDQDFLQGDLKPEQPDGNLPP